MRTLWLAVGVVVPAIAAPASAADMVTKIPTDCLAVVDPYKNYSCLDAYLGNDFLTRFVNYYRLEWGKDGPPTDPKAPPSRRSGWPATPQTTPPYPYTEWPYGGTTSIGVTRPSSVDSPLMAALSNTDLGRALNDAHVQIYGWVNVGGRFQIGERGIGYLEISGGTARANVNDGGANPALGVGNGNFNGLANNSPVGTVVINSGSHRRFGIPKKV